MREIKFRAWDKGVYSGKMIYDIQNEFEERINLGMDSFGNYLNNASFEVMQYTGVKDCNGKEVYEGDIIEITWSNDNSKHIYKLEYFDDCAMFQLVNLNDQDDLDALCGFNSNQIEVIGNIYESPELLK